MYTLQHCEVQVNKIIYCNVAMFKSLQSVTFFGNALDYSPQSTAQVKGIYNATCGNYSVQYIYIDVGLREEYVMLGE